MTGRTPPAAEAALRALSDAPDRASDLAPAALAAGATIREVGEILGLDPSYVARLWPTGRRRGPRDRPDVSDYDVLKLWWDGLGQNQIAAELSKTRATPVSVGLVDTRLARYGHGSPRHRDRESKS